MAVASDVITCQNNSLSSYFAAFEEMQKTGEFCDVRFKVSDQLLPAHKNIISAAIPYFRTMFRIDPVNADDIKEIAVEGIDSDTFQTFINFAYGRKIFINEENVRNLFLGAETLQIREITQVCREFLEQRLNPDNVFQTRLLGETSNHCSLVELCDLYIRENFNECSQREAFLDLPLSFVKGIICRDDLKVENEEAVFEMLMKWVKKSPSKRQAALPVLLKEVRLTLLSVSYLVQKVAAEDLVKNSPPCKELIEEVKNYHLLPEKHSSFCGFRTVPRFYKDAEHTIAENEVVEGVYFVSSYDYNSVEFYNLAERKWIDLHFEKIPDRKQGSYGTDYFVNKCSKECQNVVAVNDKIYAFLDNVVDILDLKTKTWETVEDYRFKNSVAVIHCNNIYIFRVSDTRTECCCLELFDSESYNITVVARTSLNINDPGVASLDDDVYIIGGTLCNEKNTRNSNDVIACNVKAKTWMKLPPMLTGRSSPGSVVINGDIYVCGGYQGIRSYIELFLTDVEVYRRSTKQWVSIAPMFSAGRVLSSVSYRGKLHVFQSSKRLLTVHIYDPETNSFVCYDVLSKLTSCSGEIKAAAVLRK